MRRAVQLMTETWRAYGLCDPGSGNELAEVPMFRSECYSNNTTVAMRDLRSRSAPM
jgi:hypothetical protein